MSTINTYLIILLHPAFSPRCIVKMHMQNVTNDIISRQSIHLQQQQQQQQQPFNGLFSRTTWVSRYQKGKTNPDALPAAQPTASKH